MSICRLLTPLLLLILPLLAHAHSPPPDARVFFIGLESGAVVKSPFRVRFGIEGFGVTPAGTRDRSKHTGGHHHLLINVGLPEDLDRSIPVDDNHLHFNNGESETQLELPPGRHTLQLLLGDEEHEPQAPPLYSERITVIVE